MQEFREYLDQELKHLDYAPVAFITAKDKRNVQAVLDLSQHLYKQTHERITTHKLNDVVKQVLTERRPSTPSGRKARIYYVTQTDVAPPTIVLFVNNPAHFNETYQRFMINRFRELLPYGEVPIKLVVRQRERQPQIKPGKPAPQATSLDDAADRSPRAPRTKTQARGSRQTSRARKPKSVGGTRTGKSRGRTAGGKGRRR